MSTNGKQKPSLVARTQAAAEAAVETIYQEYVAFPWDNREAYANWLAQTYYYVRHATRVLSFAASQCSLEDEPMHRLLLKGIKEEQGHEVLALRDLKNLGMSTEQFPELPETAAYHQTLYYAISKDGPAALIGYFLPLEGVAARKMQPEWEQVSKLYPSKATTFLKVHLKLDVSHFDEGLKGLEHASARDLQVVEKNLFYSTALYCRIVERMKTQAAESSRRLKRVA